MASLVDPGDRLTGPQIITSLLYPYIVLLKFTNLKNDISIGSVW